MFKRIKISSEEAYERTRLGEKVYKIDGFSDYEETLTADTPKRAFKKDALYYIDEYSMSFVNLDTLKEKLTCELANSPEFKKALTDFKDSIIGMIKIITSRMDMGEAAEWIPCTSNLPYKVGIYEVTLSHKRKFNYHGFAYYNTENKSWQSVCDPNEKDVVAWRKPLSAYDPAESELCE